LIDRQPSFNRFLIECDIVAIGACVAQEIPRGIKEGIHCVGIALCRLTALGTSNIYPITCRTKR